MDWSPLWTSLITAIPATFITFLLGIFTAQKVTKKDTAGTRLLDILFTIPIVLPPTVTGFLLLLFLGKNGLFGKLLSETGIQIIFTRTAIVIAAVVISFPLMYRSAKAAFEQVDQNLIYAGRTLGLSETMIFWRIIMPMAYPGVVSGGILALSRAFGEFGATLMIAGNIPKVTQTMPIAIYMAIQAGSWKEATVWGSILIMISFLMIFYMNHLAIIGLHKRR